MFWAPQLPPYTPLRSLPYGFLTATNAHPEAGQAHTSRCPLTVTGAQNVVSVVEFTLTYKIDYYCARRVYG